MILKKFLFILKNMKNLIIPLSLLVFACTCSKVEAKISTPNQAANQAENCPQVECKCNNDEKTPEIREEKGGLKKKVAVAGAFGVAMGAGAFVANKMHCDRFDIEVEYLMLDACLETCYGVAEKSARISKCARAIQDMECSQKLSQDDIHKKVTNSCPIQ
ncbi:hypothetical protein [Fibrobacter sp.]|uniref:hypothetical protein n=1 Tax=Fibrobacter sp. TaxID=35828 RepID=UPI0025BF292D|nr:hypothetical protein [Fibrobacter sp.]